MQQSAPYSKKHQMSKTLSNALLLKHLKPNSVICSVSINKDRHDDKTEKDPKNFDILDIAENLPTFNLEPFDNGKFNL